MYRFFILLMFVSFQLHAGGGVLEVEWPKANRELMKQQQSYPKALQKALNEVKMPIYLPASEMHNKGLFMVANPNYYTASIPLEGALLTISGDRTFQEKIQGKQDPVLKKRMANKALEFSREEGLVMTTFNRHNVNYTLELECDHPQVDARCLNDEFLYGIYRELRLVGGRP